MRGTRTARATAKPTKTPKAEPRSLLQFMRDKRKLTCKICQLPQSVRDELAAARAKKVPRALQLEWLQAEVGLSISGEELEVHKQGRHDDR